MIIVAEKRKEERGRQAEKDREREMARWRDGGRLMERETDAVARDGEGEHKVDKE